MRIGEHALGILERGGLTGARSVAAFSGVIALNYGWSSFTAARELDPGGAAHEVTGMLAQLPAALFPRIVAVAEEMGTYGGDEDYELVLGALVGGLGRAH